MLICVYEYKKVQKKYPRLVILPFFISNPSKRDGSWKIEKRFYTRQNVTDFYSFPKKMPKIRFLTVTNVTLKKGGERMLLEIRKNKFQCEVEFFSPLVKKFKNNFHSFLFHLSVTFIRI